jgi:hypothetical protein
MMEHPFGVQGNDPNGVERHSQGWNPWSLDSRTVYSFPPTNRTYCDQEVSPDLALAAQDGKVRQLNVALKSNRHFRATV